MDRSLSLRLGLHPERLPSPISARALDGHMLGRVTSRTNPVHMLLPGILREDHSVHAPAYTQISRSSWATPGFADTTPTSTGLLAPSVNGGSPVSDPVSGLLHRRLLLSLLLQPRTSPGSLLFTMTSEKPSIRPRPPPCPLTVPTTVPSTYFRALHPPRDACTRSLLLSEKPWRTISGVP